MVNDTDKEEEHTFDLAAIRTGNAVSTTASECSSAEWSVAVIDLLPFAGACALRGCGPKKGSYRGGKGN